MSKQAQVLISFLLMSMCFVILIQPGLAQFQIPQFPGLFPPGSSGEVTQCWSSLIGSQGCSWEIYRSVFTQQFDNIGPSCCKAYLEIDANCWPKMFPFNPFFPPLFKGYCTRIAATPVSV